MLTIDHIAAESVIVLPTSGSCGQLLVYERSVSPGRSVAAAHDVQKKKAVSASRSAFCGQRAVRHRVLVAQLGERRVVAEQALVVRRPPRGSPRRALATTVTAPLAAS